MDPLAFGVSSILTALLVWILDPLARRHGLVDRPGGRKDHALPTPVTGGLSIAVAAIATLFLVGGYSQATAAYCAASALLLTVGFLDDAYDLRWYVRILSHIAAGVLMIYWGGVRIEYVGAIFSSTPISLGVWSVPFTLFAIVGLINAVNMADGADGLGGSLSLVAVAMLGAAAVYSGNVGLMSWIIPLGSATAVFLLFNMRFPWQRRARVFLGNAGSAFLGFSIGWLTFRLTQNTGHPVSPVLAPWFLAVPLIDCLVSIARRLRMGRSPFHADRGHIHHLMLDAGFNPTQVALTLAGLTIVLGAGAALVLRTNAGTETHLVVGFIVLCAAYYWLTSRRPRALRVLGGLHRLLTPARQPVVELPDTSPAFATLGALASPAVAWSGEPAREDVVVDAGLHASLSPAEAATQDLPLDFAELRAAKQATRRMAYAAKGSSARQSGT
jgi:UDP-GlcNAc:undecaprenyl-phosphate GlcNAc-1-phosphate transferase